MAYVGSHSYTGKAKGIAVYDVSVEKGVFKERREVEVDSSSYVTAPSDGKVLYSIADEGVVSFRILQNGGPARLNSFPIHGIRGYHLCTDVKDEYVLVSDYYDDRTIVSSLNRDGSAGKIVDEVYNKGYGSVAKRNFHSRVTCTRRMPDDRCAPSVDDGTDQAKVYRFSDKDRKLVQVDATHCDSESTPRYFRYSSDGRFLHLMRKLQNVINVYLYEIRDRAPVIEKTQTISTTAAENPDSLTVACTMRLLPDEKYIYCTNADEDTATIYRRDGEPGLLAMISCLSASGEYPKDVAISPDQEYITSINHDGGPISFFEVNYEKRLLAMCGHDVGMSQPNCCTTTRIGRSW